MTIRLTVLYNLPPGSDEEEFLRWRLGEHQEQNATAPGVIRTDFGRVDALGDDKPPYRFMTIADWPDRASFEAFFYSEEAQADLKQDSERITDSLMFISEILAETNNEEAAP
jgi:heme-degrading monooxygenase HmoA